MRLPVPTGRGRRGAVLARSIALAAIAACSRGPAGHGAALAPVATVDEVMQGIVIPGSQAVFDAVGYADGKLVRAPASDDEWNRVRMQALAVAEAGNLLLMPPRARDGDEWAAAAAAMRDRAAQAAKAAERKDVDGVLLAGGEMYDACEACHRRYVEP